MAIMQRKTIVLVDSNALAHRAFHAYPATLATSKGEFTNAIFGYFSMLVQVLTTLKPDALICVFDAPGGTFRDSLYAGYKASRPEMDKQLVQQIPKMISTLQESAIQTLVYPGFEADDVIGSLVKHKELERYNKIIVTGDKDLFQMLDEHTQVYMAGNPFSTSKLYDSDSANAKMGFDVKKIVLFKALKGDDSDEIPGVNGIGDVTATELVNKYASLEDIYAHLEDIKPAVKSKLEKDKEMAELSQQLATIKTDVEIDFKIENAEVTNINFNSLKEKFAYFEFRSLVKRLEQINPQTDKKVVNVQNKVETNEKEYATVEVNNEDGFNKMLAKIKPVDKIAIHTENTKNLFTIPNYIALAIEGFTFLIQVNNVKKSEWQKLMLEIKDKVIYAHNAKYLKHIFSNIGINDFKFSEDLLLLEYISSLGAIKSSLENLIDQSDGQASLFQENPLYKQAYYIYSKSRELTADKKQTLPGKMYDLYENIEKPLIDTIYDMERNGIKLNPQELRDLEEELTRNIINIEKDIFKDADEEFNIASPKQLSNILFNKLGIKGGKKNKSGGFSTNEKFLLDHMDIPIIQNILLYRELYKLRSTYTKTLIDQVNSNTGRIHSTFNQAIAITGRLSSTDPNLQNIPTNSDWGLRIRQAFVAEQSKTLISFDYSQQELRLLAEFSGDTNLKRAFQEGFDIHAYTASNIFNIPIDQVSSTQRRAAKTVNFGVVYGISAYGLSARLKIRPDEAQAFIDGFYASYPMALEYFHSIVAEAKKVGYIETLFGRRKSAELLNADHYQIRMGAEREIINFPLQGSAAEIMKIAMLDTDKLIKDKYSDFAIMVLQVHDELIFEVDSDNLNLNKLQSFVKDIKNSMNNGVKLKVPMLVEAKAGKNWSQLSRID